MWSDRFSVLISEVAIHIQEILTNLPNVMFSMESNMKYLQPLLLLGAFMAFSIRLLNTFPWFRSFLCALKTFIEKAYHKIKVRPKLDEKDSKPKPEEINENEEIYEVAMDLELISTDKQPVSENIFSTEDVGLPPAKINLNVIKESLQHLKSTPSDDLTLSSEGSDAASKRFVLPSLSNLFDMKNEELNCILNHIISDTTAYPKPVSTDLGVCENVGLLNESFDSKLSIAPPQESQDTSSDTSDLLIFSDTDMNMPDVKSDELNEITSLAKMNMPDFTSDELNEITSLAKMNMPDLTSDELDEITSLAKMNTPDFTSDELDEITSLAKMNMPDFTSDEHDKITSLVKMNTPEFKSDEFDEITSLAKMNMPDFTSDEHDEITSLAEMNTPDFTSDELDEITSLTKMNTPDFTSDEHDEITSLVKMNTPHLKSDEIEEITSSAEINKTVLKLKEHVEITFSAEMTMTDLKFEEVFEITRSSEINKPILKSSQLFEITSPAEMNTPSGMQIYDLNFDVLDEIARPANEQLKSSESEESVFKSAKSLVEDNETAEFPTELYNSAPIETNTSLTDVNMKK